MLITPLAQHVDVQVHHGTSFAVLKAWKDFYVLMAQHVLHGGHIPNLVIQMAPPVPAVLVIVTLLVLFQHAHEATQTIHH